MCDYADMAGTVYRTRDQLRAGKHGEHEDYWKTDAHTGRMAHLLHGVLI
jgi:hypothetical protein